MKERQICPADMTVSLMITFCYCANVMETQGSIFQITILFFSRAKSVTIFKVSTNEQGRFESLHSQFVSENLSSPSRASGTVVEILSDFRTGFAPIPSIQRVLPAPLIGWLSTETIRKLSTFREQPFGQTWTSQTRLHQCLV
jgi:hypothetical protein